MAGSDSPLTVANTYVPAVDPDGDVELELHASTVATTLASSMIGIAFMGAGLLPEVKSGERERRKHRSFRSASPPRRDRSSRPLTAATPIASVQVPRAPSPLDF